MLILHETRCVHDSMNRTTSNLLLTFYIQVSIENAPAAKMTITF